MRAVTAGSTKSAAWPSTAHPQATARHEANDVTRDGEDDDILGSVIQKVGCRSGVPRVDSAARFYDGSSDLSHVNCATPSCVEGCDDEIGATIIDDGLKTPGEGRLGIVCGKNEGEGTTVMAVDCRGEERVYTLVQLSTRYARLLRVRIIRLLELVVLNLTK